MCRFCRLRSPLALWYLVSRQTNDIGTYENITGTSPTAGARVYTWNGAGYSMDSYDPDVGWDSGTGPVVAVGGAIWISPAGNGTPPGSSVICPTNKTVECGSAWTFDAPTVTGPCGGTNANITVVNIVTNGTGCSQSITCAWQVYDTCGGSAQCSQTVTVVDTRPPVSTNCCDNCTSPITNTVVVNVGNNFLVNPLCHGTNNTVGVLLPNVPDGTVIYKWDTTSQTYDPVIIFDSASGGWVDYYTYNDASGVTLEPGHGFALENPDGPFTITWIGCIPTCQPPCLPTASGSSLVGGVGPGAATWTNLSRCPPVCGTRVYAWNGIGFDEYDFFTSWTPSVPVVAPGHSVFVSFVTSTNCLPCTNNLVVNGGFEVTSPAVPPNTPIDTLSPTTGVPGWTTALTDYFEVWGNIVNNLPAAEGVNQMEICARSTDQTVWQVVTNLSTNCLATFCFKYTGRFGLAGATYNNDFTVTLSTGNSVTGDLLSVDLDPTIYSIAGWTNYCLGFIPPTSTITIGFRGHPHYTNGYPTAGGAHIDDVSLMQCCTNPCITMSCPSDKTVQCGSQWNFDDLTNIVDTCCSNYNLAVTTQTQRGSCTNVYTRTWVVSDACGNSNSCSQTVTVLPSAPQLQCTNLTIACGSPIPTNPPAWTDACCSNVTVTLIGSTVTDNGCSQTIAQTWAAFDQCCGTSNTCTRIISVVPATPTDLFPTPGSTYASSKDADTVSFVVPGAGVVTARNLSVGNLLNPIAPPPLNGSATYNAGSAATACEVSLDGGQTWYASMPTGMVVLHLVHALDAGNTSFFDTEMLQLDLAANSPSGPLGLRESPTKASLGRHTIQTASQGYAVSSFFDVFLELSLDGGQTWTPGSQPIRLQGVNPSALALQCSNVTITCGSPIPTNPPAVTGTCCSNVTVTLLSSTTTNDGCNQTIYQTWAAFDPCCGTSNTCVRTVTVVDTTPPAITCSSNKTVLCGSPWNFDAPAASDDCSGTNVTITFQTATNGPCPQSITRTWTATDLCGNTNTCSQTVTLASCVPPPSGMVLWLPFDEASGTNTANLCVGGNNGALVNGPAHNLGSYVNNSLCFDGQNDYVEVADYSAINIGTGDFSVDAWVKPATLNNSIRVIVDHRAEANGAIGYSLFLGGNNTIGFQIADGTEINYPSPFVVPADGQWHLVAVTVKRDDPQGIHFYLDGVVGALGRDPTGHPNSITPPPNYPFRVGSRSSSVSGLFSGCIDEVEVFSRELATTEVQAMYNAGPAGKCKSPKLACSAPKTVPCGTQISFDPPVVNDPCCGTNPVVVQFGSDVSGGTACASTLTRTWLYVDCCGSSNFCSQTVSVVDTTPPDFGLPGDKTVECGAPWAFDPPQVLDACCGSNVTLVVLSTVTNGTAPCSFVATRTWRATDCCGNSATNSQAVTVMDTKPPVFGLPGDKTIDCGTPWAFDPPQVIDDCCGLNVSLVVLSTVTNGTAPVLARRHADVAGHRLLW